MLAVLNGLPFINVRPTTIKGASALDDLAVAVLIGFLAVCAVSVATYQWRDRVVQGAAVWAAVYLCWWGWEITRAANDGGSLISSVAFGRDILYFGLFLPLGLAAIRRRAHLQGFGVVLALGAALFSLGQIAVVLFGTSLPWLLHVGKVADFQGLTRIYAPMNDLVIAMFPLAIGFALLGPVRWRRWALIFAALTGAANALSFTRAVYASETVALILVGLVYALRAGWEGQRIRRVLLVGVAFAVMTLGVAGSAANSTTGGPVRAVVTRVALGFSDVQGQGGSFGYRLDQASYELQALHGRWLTGVGFRPPDSFWVPGERDGSIRNSDLGSLSLLTTMGLFGLLLAYAPPIVGLVYLLRRRGALAFGGSMYLAVALIGSITLATLSSVSGLLVLACLLVLCVNGERASATGPTRACRWRSDRSVPPAGDHRVHERVPDASPLHA